MLSSQRRTGSSCRVGKLRCAGRLRPPVAKSPPSFMSFCSPSYFPSQNPVEHACSRFLLPRTFPRPSTLSSYLLPFSPAFPFSVLPFVQVLHMFVPHFPLFPYFPCLSRTSPPKILLSMPTSGPSTSVLPSPYPNSLPYFPVLWIFY